MCTWSESEGETGALSQVHFARCSTAVLHNHIVNFDVSGACSGHVCVCVCIIIIDRERVLSCSKHV